MTNNLNNLTLNQVLDRMREMSEQGYDVFFEGLGNCMVRPVAEYYEILDEKKLNKEKEKNKEKSV